MIITPDMETDESPGFPGRNRTSEGSEPNRRREVDRLLDEFRLLDRVLIDSSSIIYAARAGFLGTLAGTVRLFSIIEVIRETGEAVLEARIRVLASTGSGPVDERVVRAAIHLGLPLVSDDRKVLRKVGAAGVPCFNSLMMLHLLLFRSAIDPDRHRRCLESLLDYAWYGREILEFGDRVLLRLREGERQDS